MAARVRGCAAGQSDGALLVSPVVLELRLPGRGVGTDLHHIQAVCLCAIGLLWVCTQWRCGARFETFSPCGRLGVCGACFEIFAPRQHLGCHVELVGVSPPSGVALLSN